MPSTRFAKMPVCDNSNEASPVKTNNRYAGRMADVFVVMPMLAKHAAPRSWRCRDDLEHLRPFPCGCPGGPLPGRAGASFVRRGMETAVKKSLTTELPTAVAGGSNADLFVIAEIRDFPSLLAAMRKRVADLRTTYDCVDDAAFLATGYTNRLLRRYPEKRMSPQTFGGLLLGLGCKLLLVQDDEAFAKVRDKLRPSKWPGAHPWLET